MSIWLPLIQEELLKEARMLKHEIEYYFCTFSCETCHYWFHFECVGVAHTDECVLREDVPYYCPTCVKPKKQQKVSNRETKSSTPSQKSSKKRKTSYAKENEIEASVILYLMSFSIM